MNGKETKPTKLFSKTKRVTFTQKVTCNIACNIAWNFVKIEDDKIGNSGLIEDLCIPISFENQTSSFTTHFYYKLRTASSTILRVSRRDISATLVTLRVTLLVTLGVTFTLKSQVNFE